MIYNKHTANIYLDGEKLKEFQQNSVIRQSCPPSPYALVPLKILAIPIRQLKKDCDKIMYFFEEDIIVGINIP